MKARGRPASCIGLHFDVPSSLTYPPRVMLQTFKVLKVPIVRNLAKGRKPHNDEDVPTVRPLVKCNLFWQALSTPVS